MPLPRRLFAGALRAQIDAVIGDGDQRYGRQLATMLEAATARLRDEFGVFTPPAGAEKTRLNREREAERIKAAQAAVAPSAKKPWRCADPTCRGHRFGFPVDHPKGCAACGGPMERAEFTE